MFSFISLYLKNVYTILQSASWKGKKSTNVLVRIEPTSIQNPARNTKIAYLPNIVLLSEIRHTAKQILKQNYLPNIPCFHRRILVYFGINKLNLRDHTLILRCLLG